MQVILIAGKTAAMKKVREAELKTENKDIKTEFIESKNIESKDSTHDSI